MRWNHLIAAPLLLVLVACPPVRGGGGGGDGGGGNNADPTHGSLIYSPVFDYYGGYQYASFAFRTEGDISCAEWSDAGYDAEELDGEWVAAFIYRGTEVPWEQTYYGLYDSENDCGVYDDEYDYSDLHCFAARSSDGSYWEDGELTVSQWTSNRVEGNLTTSLVDVDFEVTNCGEHDPYVGDDDDDDDSGMRDEAREEPDDDSGGRWRLRLR